MQYLREASFEIFMLDQFGKGNMDPNILNFILKIKRGGGIYNLFYFRDRSFDHWRGGLNFLTFDVVCYLFSRFLCSGRLLRNIGISLFLLGLQVISVWAAAGLVPLSQLI